MLYVATKMYSDVTKLVPFLSSNSGCRAIPDTAQLVYAVPLKDRQILMAHSNSETTKIYARPNFELTAEFINRSPEWFNVTDSYATKRIENMTTQSKKGCIRLH